MKAANFALFAGTTPLWTSGVPLALLGAFELCLSVYWVGRWRWRTRLTSS